MKKLLFLLLLSINVHADENKFVHLEDVNHYTYLKCGVMIISDRKYLMLRRNDSSGYLEFVDLIVSKTQLSQWVDKIDTGNVKLIPSKELCKD